MFLVQIHTEIFWSTPNYHSDCIKYTSTGEINISEIRTESILSVNKKLVVTVSVLSFHKFRMKKVSYSQTLDSLNVSRHQVTSSKALLYHLTFWIYFPSCGKHLFDFPQLSEAFSHCPEMSQERIMISIGSIQSS